MVEDDGGNDVVGYLWRGLAGGCDHWLGSSLLAYSYRKCPLSDLSLFHTRECTLCGGLYMGWVLVHLNLIGVDKRTPYWFGQSVV